MAGYASLIPVNVLTGFLGSGKTTLLKRLLQSPRLRDTAVLVNEFGEVGLDHHLLEAVKEDTVLLGDGCLCCSMRGDLAGAMRSLYSRRERGEIPPFRRVVIETSGLSDPVPIAYTLLSEPVIRHHFRLGILVATVDAVNASSQLERHGESVKQVAVADRLVITKTDLADPAATEALRQQLIRLNPSASLHDSGDDIDPVHLLVDDAYDEEGRSREIHRWIGPLDAAQLHQEDHLLEKPGHDTHNHDAHNHDIHSQETPGHAPPGKDNMHGDITAHSFHFSEPLDWTAFAIWLTMLLHCHGERVLRVKGLLNVEGEPTPVVLNGVQHIVHPPAHLEAWPDGERRSRLVFIAQGISRRELADSLAAFNGLGRGNSAAQPGIDSGGIGISG